MKISLEIPTPLGSLEIMASVVSGSASVSVDAFEFHPALPQAMQVAKCCAVLLQVSEVKESSALEFRAQLHPSVPASGGAATGEGLEANEWRSDRHVLIVGTEDSEYLRARLPVGAWQSDDAFTYAGNGLSFTICTQPATRSISAHFIAAWNELPEEADCSCWYAVDQPHKTIEALAADHATHRTCAASRAVR